MKMERSSFGTSEEVSTHLSSPFHYWSVDLFFSSLCSSFLPFFLLFLPPFILLFLCLFLISPFLSPLPPSFHSSFPHSSLLSSFTLFLLLSLPLFPPSYTSLTRLYLFLSPPLPTLLSHLSLHLPPISLNASVVHLKLWPFLQLPGLRLHEIGKSRGTTVT